MKSVESNVSIAAVRDVCRNREAKNPLSGLTVAGWAMRSVVGSCCQ